MIYRRGQKVLVQGITGKQGSFWAEKMREFRHNDFCRRKSEAGRRAAPGTAHLRFGKGRDASRPLRYFGHLHPTGDGA